MLGTADTPLAPGQTVPASRWQHVLRVSIVLVPCAALSPLHVWGAVWLWLHATVGQVGGQILGHLRLAAGGGVEKSPNAV